MNTWPSISNPDFPLLEIVNKRRVESEAEFLIKEIRALGTIFVRQYELNWSKLPESEYQTLATFFVDNQGLFFNWSRPFDLQSLTCRFINTEIKTSVPFENHREVSLTIETKPEVHP